MRKMMSRKKIIVLSAAAFCMTGLLTLEQAAAYFTTYVSAGGSQVVHLGAKTEIHEDVVNMAKHISVTNKSQTNDCFVRVKVFYGGEIEVDYEDKSKSTNLWTYSAQDRYYYYEPVLPAGKSTETLDLKIDVPSLDYDRESFNVVVVQECTPVIYDDAGAPSADWNTVYTDYSDASGTQGEGAR